jgi:hypothetical protein
MRVAGDWRKWTNYYDGIPETGTLLMFLML